MKVIDNPNYKISSIILTKPESFTIKQIADELKNKKNELSESIIKNVLEEFIDCGIITLEGNKYYLAI